MPERFQRSDNPLRAATEHQQLLSGIYQTQSLLQRLFLKFFQCRDAATLTQIDEVLAQFFGAIWDDAGQSLRHH